jgi:hypothetical protein
MAKGALFIGWGRGLTGRELKGLQVFDDSIHYYTRLQEQGQIDSFEAFVLEPHGGDLQGFLLVRGDVDKLNAARYSDEFQSLNARAGLVIDNLGVVMAFGGEELQKQLSRFQTAVAEVG